MSWACCRSASCISGTGKREQAREHLTTATTMYREMDMSFWLEQVEAETLDLT